MSRVVCVVGMHRSGTSCLAGTLEEAGLHLGNVITEAPHNVKGNRENKRIMDLQEAILVHSGGSWEAVPARLSWTDAHRAERDAIIASYSGREFGFKDPRTLVTLPFWREVLPELDFVGTFRHPRLVAESLLRRNGGEASKWLDLWAAYNERLLALHAEAPFPIVRFDVEEGRYRQSLEAVTARLGLPAPAALRFFEPTLRHHHRTPELDGDVTDARVTALYERLCALAV